MRPASLDTVDQLLEPEGETEPGSDTSDKYREWHESNLEHDSSLWGLVDRYILNMEDTAVDSKSFETPNNPSGALEIAAKQHPPVDGMKDDMYKKALSKVADQRAGFVERIKEADGLERKKMKLEASADEFWFINSRLGQAATVGTAGYALVSASPGPFVLGGAYIVGKMANNGTPQTVYRIMNFPSVSENKNDLEEIWSEASQAADALRDDEIDRYDSEFGEVEFLPTDEIQYKNLHPFGARYVDAELRQDEWLRHDEDYESNWRGLLHDSDLDESMPRLYQGLDYTFLGLDKAEKSIDNVMTFPLKAAYKISDGVEKLR